MPVTIDLRGVFGQEPSPFRVRFPGWDDVVHFQPRSWADEETYQAQRAQWLEDVARSPSPKVVTDFARIGMEIDNVQDALVTLSVAGRVATKLTGRLLPGVGWIATAADVLNLLNVFYPPTLGDVTRWFTGKGGKRKALEYARLQGGTYRRRLEETLKTGKVGFGLGEALQVLQTADWLFGVGIVLGPIFGASQDAVFGLLRGSEFDLPPMAEVLMARQSAAALFRVNQYVGTDVTQLLPMGVSMYIGLMLGALGAGADGFTRADYAAETLKVTWPGILPALDWAGELPPGTNERLLAEVLGPVVGAAKAGVLAVLHAVGVAQRVGYEALVTLGRTQAYFGGYRDELPWQLHLDLAVGQALALSVLKPAMQAGDWGAAAQTAIARPWWGGALPLVPEAVEMTVGEVCGALLERGATRPQTWLDEVQAGPGRDFAHSLVSSTADELVDALEGPDVQVREDAGQLWRAVVGMHEEDLMVPKTSTDAERLAYIEGAAALTPPVGDGYASRESLVALYQGIWPGVDTSEDGGAG